ncbi:hypothetical protein AO277_16145 [Pseudomonas amygdali]|nr:hypothetical protein AO277_16145 [Pseudomonas amygdali]
MITDFKIPQFAAAGCPVQQLGQIVADQLESGAEITLPGIGKLKVAERPARTGRNPSTGAAIEIAAKKVVKFVSAKVLNDAIKNAGSFANNPGLLARIDAINPGRKTR